MLLWTGFLFGLLGSLHCLGMCAPLVWAIPQSKEARSIWWRNRLAYNFGRAITYSILGLFIGLVGEALAFAGFQQYLSIVTGSLMLIFLLISKGSIPQSFSSPYLNQIILKLKKLLGSLIQKNNLRSNALMGLYNGLLPCGLVYMALLASLSMSSLGGSSLYMLVFGLGTFPMMIGAAFFGKQIKEMSPGIVSNWVPRFMVLVAILLIVRGMNLGIPYLSPAVNSNEGITVCEIP